MTIQTFYRLCMWIPLALPALVALVVHGLALPHSGTAVDKVIQILLMSLVYGGLPYAVIAMWGTLWIGKRPEAELRRRALRAPLLMSAAFVIFPILIVLRGAPMDMAIAVYVLGAVCSLVLGYLYVALVLGLRDLIGDRLT